MTVLNFKRYYVSCSDLVPSLSKMSSMELNMGSHKAGDEVIGVVVSALNSQSVWPSLIIKSLLKQFRLQLLLQEIVLVTLIN